MKRAKERVRRHFFLLVPPPIELPADVSERGVTVVGRWVTHSTPPR